MNKVRKLFSCLLWIAVLSCQAQTRPFLFEQNVNWASGSYNNVWEDVSLTVVFTSPTQRNIQVGGFYYAQDTWKFRLAPDESGPWQYTATITDGVQSKTWNDTFLVESASISQFVRPSTANPFRWSLTSGEAFYPVGINDCVFNRKANENVIDPDGPIRFWLDQAIVEKEQYFQTFGKSGVNLFRWGPDNCAISLYDNIAPEGNRYRDADGLRIDDMLLAAQQNNIRVYQVLFGFQPPYGQAPTGDQMNAVKRYLKYMVDRYGALVDFWELMNEARVDEAWYQHAIAYLRAIDPYQHPISTSFEFGQHPGIQINSPHWYQSEPEQSSDLITSQNLAGWKATGKPVIVGEQGNLTQSWDSSSGLRMRLRLWAAMFSEGSLVFWNSARFLPEVHAFGDVANIYLGPDERSYIDTVQKFSNHVPPDAVACGVAASTGVRAYGLCGQDSLHIYLHHFADHTQPASQVTLWISVPKQGSLIWIQPQTGAVAFRQDVSAGWQQVTAPDFLVDLAVHLAVSNPN